MYIEIPVSLGELVDKITILEIKEVHILDVDKRHNIRHELELLQSKLTTYLSLPQFEELEPLKRLLKDTNEELWTIEDSIRDCERNKQFTDQFIKLARSVYITNDTRAALKKQINQSFGSDLIEEKSYSPY